MDWIHSCCVVSAGLKETTEKLVKEKLEGKDKLTPWEGYLQKKKEKKKQKKSGKKQVGWTPTLKVQGVHIMGLILVDPVWFSSWKTGMWVWSSRPVTPPPR